MKKLILIIVFLCVGVEGFGWKPDKWTMQDNILQGSLITLNYIDTLQTFYFLSKGKKESNPILGIKPSRKRIYLYDFITMSLHASIAYALPKKYNLRTIWQSIYIGVVSKTIYSNCLIRSGFHIKF